MKKKKKRQSNNYINLLTHNRINNKNETMYWERSGLNVAEIFPVKTLWMMIDPDKLLEATYLSCELNFTHVTLSVCPYWIVSLKKKNCAKYILFPVSIHPFFSLSWQSMKIYDLQHFWKRKRCKQLQTKIKKKAQEKKGERRKREKGETLNLRITSLFFKSQMWTFSPPVQR